MDNDKWGDLGHYIYKSVRAIGVFGVTITALIIWKDFSVLWLLLFLSMLFL